MSDDILKKPVHVAILKPTQLQKLQDQGKLSKRAFAVESPSLLKLPTETQRKFGIPKVSKPAVNLQKQAVHRTRLNVIHSQAPAVPEDKKPPCETCQTSACCQSFLVPLTKDEYESGIYGSFAVKFTKKELEQLQGKTTLMTTLRTPVRVASLRDQDALYYLEGAVGEPCPFLKSDGKCGIYSKRPMACRVYTCVDDDRISQAMRDGEEDIESAMMNWMLNNAK